MSSKTKKTCNKDWRFNMTGYMPGGNLWVVQQSSPRHFFHTPVMTLTYPIPRLSLLVVYCNIYFSLSSRLSLCTRQTTPNSNRPNTSNSSSSDEPACLGSLKSPAISPSQVPARRSQSQRLGMDCEIAFSIGLYVFCFC